MDEIRIAAGGGVDRDLVGAGVQQGADVVDGADAAADGQRHEDDFRRAANDVEHDLAAFVAGGDVEEDELVGPLFFVARSDRHRIAGVAEIEEIRPLDDSAPVDIKTRYHPFGEHRAYDFGVGSGVSALAAATEGQSLL